VGALRAEDLGSAGVARACCGRGTLSVLHGGTDSG